MFSLLIVIYLITCSFANPFPPGLGSVALKRREACPEDCTNCTGGKFVTLITDSGVFGSQCLKDLIATEKIPSVRPQQDASQLLMAQPPQGAMS